MTMKTMGRAGLRGLVALTLAMTVAGLVQAQGAAAASDKAAAAKQPLALADYLRPAQYARPQLSPDGTKLAVLAPVGDKRNLVVMDVATMKVLQHSSFSTFDVINFTWIGSDWIWFTQGRIDTPTGPDSADGGGEFVTKADGSKVITLMANARDQARDGQRRLRGMSLAARGKGKSEIVVFSNQRSAESQDVISINLDTNERVMLTPQHPGEVQDWVLDQDGIPRVAVLGTKKDEALPPEQRFTRIVIRDKVDGEWREIAKFSQTSGARWMPMAFAPNNRDLIVSYRGDRDTTALYRFDTTKGELAEQIAGNPRYDLGVTENVGGATLLRRDRKVVGFRFDDETQQTAYFDEGMARRQAMLEKSFPGMAVSVQDTDSNLALVAVQSDRSAPVYYLFDQERKSMRELLRASEKLDERNLVAMRPFLLKTRDGLEIPSYYFLPASYKPGQKLPVVVHIHGGPFARADVWGTQTFGAREAQLLASRGYAVVLPNFRITPGFGQKIYRAGFGEYGRKMSEDHEDAAKWAVAEGFADPKRICIGGASYGGAAALWATIKSADVFACAIAGAAPSDPRIQNTSTQTDYAGSEGGVAHWKRVLGVKGDDWSPADEVAPARHADRSRIPLFIYSGQDDQRVPIEQTRLMVDALKKAGKPPEMVMIKEGEGHGYGKLENNIDLYTEMLKFLERHIGVGPTPGTGVAAETPAAAAAK
ncbi:alpha/beta fold hydrolase [Roseateles sp.]|uniref:alpha/beta hydrolase family protein n=1 Tax=Roseateles sp. TaxID=1971397 RepID=UPI0031D69066